MTPQDIQAIRSLIAKHKRWDIFFGLLGLLSLMVGMLTFMALFVDMAMQGGGAEYQL